MRMRIKDGVLRDADVAVGLITFEGSTASIVTIRDITERKMNRLQLEALYNEERQLRNSLQEEIENRSKYTRALVHELKTPLTAILSSSELLEAEIQDKILLALIKNVRSASLTLEHRTNELIELACGEIGILNVEYELLDLAKLTREIAEEIKPLISEKGLALITEISDELIVKGDLKRLSQVIANLLRNAVKYTNHGKIIIRAASNDSDMILVQITDTGCGIEKKQMEHLFDPYRRPAQGGLNYSGLGMGLALSKLYIELHKGKIWAESEPGRGSIFSFSIPLCKDHCPVRQPEPARPDIARK
jgi:two-component system, OmpR family, aerobic respiration control sensor histidine kinase ArcB